MSLYPQGILADSGTECFVCGGEKRRGARFCFRHNPAFSSHSKGIAWCEGHAVGPCWFIFTEYNRSGVMGLIYNRGNFHCRGEWPEEPERAWHD